MTCRLVDPNHVPFMSVIAALVKLNCVPTAFTVIPAGGELESKSIAVEFPSLHVPLLPIKYIRLTPRKFDPLITNSPIVAL